MSKPRVGRSFGISCEGCLRLLKRHPACSWRDSRPRFCMGAFDLPQALLQQLASAHRSRECLEGIKQGLAFSNTVRREKRTGKLVMPRSSGSEIQDCRPRFVGSTGLQLPGAVPNAQPAKVACGSCNFIIPARWPQSPQNKLSEYIRLAAGRRRRAQADHGFPRPDDSIATRCADRLIYLDGLVALAHLLAEDRSLPESIWGETPVSCPLVEYAVWNRINARRLGQSPGEAARVIGRLALIELAPLVLAVAWSRFQSRCERSAPSTSDRSNSCVGVDRQSRWRV
jgi:hypothetical protein